MLDDNSFIDIASLDSLTRAHKKAMKGKRSQPIPTASDYTFMSGLLGTQRQIVGGTYRPLPYKHRVITEPKTRHIEAPAFQDRVVHHAVHRVVSTFYERFFIYDSYACRPGRGTHKGMARVQGYLRSEPELYVLKIDISKYYASINHNKLVDLLKKRIKSSRLLGMLCSIIGSSKSNSEHDHLFPPHSHYHTKKPRGIPIGNLTSQLFANIYLHELDMYAKHKLKIRRYVRYMDDMLIFHSDKEQLKSWQSDIVDFLYDELYLTVNPRKVRIYPSRLGVDFVGFVIWPFKMRVRSSSVRRFRRRFNQQLKSYVNGHTDITEIEASLNSWTAHLQHANNKQLIQQFYTAKENAEFVRWVQDAHKKYLNPRPNLVVPTTPHLTDFIDFHDHEA